MILDILLYLLLFIVLAAAGFVGFIFLRSHLGASASPGSFFGPKPEKRLDVVEQWSLDARRRLVLIRRDDVEHLIMTGGPVDVVIETGIGEKPKARMSETSAPVFARSARGLGTPAPLQPSPLPPAASAVNGAQPE
jgi:flagellar protein FliO/FliZ